MISAAKYMRRTKALSEKVAKEGIVRYVSPGGYLGRMKVDEFGHPLRTRGPFITPLGVVYIYWIKLWKNGEPETT